jgi:integrase
MSVSSGTLYQRGKTWTINYTMSGRRVREAIGPSRKLAEMVLKKRVTEAIEGRWFDKRNIGLTSFSEFAEIYLTRHISLLKSTKTERDRVLFWKREFGTRPLGQITRAELQDWQARKRQINKPATVNRIMCRLRHMFNKAVEWELLDKSPMERLKFLPENNARLRYLSMEECKRLLDACVIPHMRALATLALHTGMRRGEILNLRFDDIDFASGHIIIRDSKNGQPRHIPMDSTVRELLSGYIPTSGSSHVFPSASGGRLSTVQKAFRNARTRAGMPGLHFHDLRHTFASQWMMSGGDLYVLKEILGHKSITMTQRYAHLSPAFKQAMVDRMEQMWAKPGETPVETAASPSEGSPRHRSVTIAATPLGGVVQNPLRTRVSQF